MTDPTDPTEGLFSDLDRPRPLPAELRQRLEERLLSAADAPVEVTPPAMVLGADLDERLRTTLTDPVALALSGIDGPRPLPPELRASLEGQLVRRRTAQRFLGAAAAVVLVVALAVVLTQGGSAGHRNRPAPAAAPVPTSVAGDGEATGGVAVGSGGGSAGAGAAPAGVSRVPAPTPADQRLGGTTAYSARGQVAVRGASPDAGPVSGGTTVMLHGQGLSTTSAVYFGARAATSYTVVSDTTVRAVTPAAASAGKVDIVVRLGANGSDRLPAAFSYLPPPSVSSLSPAAGPSAGGTWVTINGDALSRATAVSFSGVAATRIEVVSDGQLRALSPQHSAGPVDVTVTTPGGTSATNAGDRYTYLP